MRHAGRDVLSLALMDARNHTLHVMAQFEPVLSAPGFAVPTPGELLPPAWTGGHVGWFQEWWIARNLQRQLGPMADPTALGFDRAAQRRVVAQRTAAGAGGLIG